MSETKDRRDYYRQRNAKWANDPGQVAKKRERDAKRYERIKDTPEYRARMYAKDQRQRQTVSTQFKDFVRRQTRTAVKRGFIIEQPCEICGCAEVEAHHEDYTRPFDVRWLCNVHHAELHMIARRIGKGQRIDFLSDELRALLTEGEAR